MQFFKRVLEKLGWKRIRIEMARQATNASQYVIENFLVEVRELFERRHQRNLVLIAILDGDEYGYEKRLRQLRESLDESDSRLEEILEKVVIQVPTWNIETWIGFLGKGVSVDETRDHKRSPRADWLPSEPKPGRPSREWNQLVKNAADRFVELLRQPDPAAEVPDGLPALVEGLTSMQRLTT